ncbi:hypothetical protein VF21_02984 [Pseudogymnoascus sp. 05NY08]|nr:hypothetical protein VF21_02984 [Pseudogymnoascus sp. 05NY08]
MAIIAVANKEPLLGLFTVLGRPLKFTGVGYHDKNWGDKPFTTHVSSWYWGHGRLGPYSIVWFDVLGKDGTEYFSSYAARDGKIIVRPTGHNSEYPPKITSGNPEGLHIDLDLGEAGMLRVDVKADTVLANAFLYNRMSSLLTSGVDGGPQHTGVSVYEEFKLQF